MKPSVVAVLDVGKTNKKLSLYDQSLHVLGEERTTIQPGEQDGLEVEATGDLMNWFRGALRKLGQIGEVQGIAVTAHGATAALLDESGALVFPVISYTSEKGASVQDAFYEAFGDRRELHRISCTPDLGFANLGKAFFYVKTRMPEVWKRCRHALFYNSYLSYELSGSMGIEHTYLGNHSYLWDFHNRTWSSVATTLGVDQMFPSTLSSPWQSLGPLKPSIAHECQVPDSCCVSMGIHDSNANFLPYLAKGFKDFVLNSTGTWCVGMRQADTPDLSDAEIDAKVLYNLDAFGRPLKTSIFPAGMEYDTFRNFTAAKDEGDFDAVRSVIKKKALFIIPGVLPDASAFPGARPRVIVGGNEHPLGGIQGGAFTDLGQEYFAALNLSLAIATRAMLERCGAQRETTVFVEGGFARNTSYCALLAALCPQYTIALTNMQEGTSFGAAITAWIAAGAGDLAAIGRNFNIETKQVPVVNFSELDAYARAFQERLTQ